MPTAAPSVVTDDLKATTIRLGPALPQIAALLGVEIPPGTPKPKPLRAGPPRKDGRKDGRGGGRTENRKDGRKDTKKDARNDKRPAGDGGRSNAPSPAADDAGAADTVDTPATTTEADETPPAAAATADASPPTESGATDTPVEEKTADEIPATESAAEATAAEQPAPSSD